MPVLSGRVREDSAAERVAAAASVRTSITSLRRPGTLHALAYDVCIAEWSRMTLGAPPENVVSPFADLRLPLSVARFQSH